MFALVVEAAPDLPRVLAGRDRILQALAALVSNALDVTSAGGRVALRAPEEGTRREAPGTRRAPREDLGSH